ncbi:MAG: hypothetical protein PHY31_04075 [Smithellaceae bacterium]|nr:hypothetical protein [Smithellaceae bacterium]
MLSIRPIMNSAMEEVINFKTACSFRLADQNLEIQVSNTGPEEVTLPSYFDLEGEGKSTRIATLFPSGLLCVGPGEVKSFYCTMDETLWRTARTIVLYDSAGQSYRQEIVEVTG